ncbi:mitogen-activated protein kinase kinase kinase 17-like [Cornus florida]|uniref:mitogen-activated protein kinase kinase kinase 17-like n=1 Tax=Cornus florida TaxID=4283 RepID=UPI0028977271|nr:mitogen-activated protein kinase kinase kinase 17-like [Cornus florida]
MVGHGQCLSPQPGDWMKGKLVGSGSFGTVHLAMNKATGALFVVKSSQSELGLKFLENEANILENLSSPYTVQCIGKDVTNTASTGEKRLDLFMEYMCGGSLADVAEKFGGVLDERVIRLYTREILQGLKYLHKNGIVHCDLKCKNVLLGSSGNVKLADFGCAIDLKHSNERSTHFCKSMGGTPLWMAPEVLRNEGLDFAADIWSLGCTVIEMATGRPPWGDVVSNPMAAVLKIACSDGVPQFPVHFSKQGLDFLAKCLERNPKRRWTSEELLNHPFVTGELSVDGRNSVKEDVCSPASVLDIRNYEDGSDEDDSEDESHDGGEFPSRFPFLVMQSGRRNSALPMQQQESDLGSSGTWVTVRSG